MQPQQNSSPRRPRPNAAGSAIASASASSSNTNARPKIRINTSPSVPPVPPRRPSSPRPRPPRPSWRTPHEAPQVPPLPPASPLTIPTVGSDEDSEESAYVTARSTASTSMGSDESMASARSARSTGSGSMAGMASMRSLSLGPARGRAAKSRLRHAAAADEFNLADLRAACPSHPASPPPLSASGSSPSSPSSATPTPADPAAHPAVLPSPPRPPSPDGLPWFVQGYKHQAPKGTQPPRRAPPTPSSAGEVVGLPWFAQGYKEELAAGPAAATGPSVPPWLADAAQKIPVQSESSPVKHTVKGDGPGSPAEKEPNARDLPWFAEGYKQSMQKPPGRRRTLKKPAKAATGLHLELEETSYVPVEEGRQAGRERIFDANKSLCERQGHDIIASARPRDMFSPVGWGATGAKCRRCGGHFKGAPMPRAPPEIIKEDPPIEIWSPVSPVSIVSSASSTRSPRALSTFSAGSRATTMSTMSGSSRESRISRTSHTSRASRTSHASRASHASHLSHTSHTSYTSHDSGESSLTHGSSLEPLSPAGRGPPPAPSSRLESVFSLGRRRAPLANM